MLINGGRMEILGWVRLGDKAACGGTVSEGEPASSYNGIPYTFQGARIACKRNCVVLEATDHFTLPNGKNVPHHGHRTSSGCPLLSTANDESGCYNEGGAPVPESFVMDNSGNWIGCGPGFSAQSHGASGVSGATSTATSGTEIVEQSFAFLDQDGQPVEGYHYDLYREGELHVNSAFFHNGLTVPVGGEAGLELVAWLTQDGAAKHG